jgi:hypothetical protein
MDWMRWPLLIALSLSACYAPTAIDCSFRCGALPNACPLGLACDDNGWCRTTSPAHRQCEPTTDGGTDANDSAIDAAVDHTPAEPTDLATAGPSDLALPSTTVLAPPVAVPAGTRSSVVATADLNHDGRLDLVVGEAGSMTIQVLRGVDSPTLPFTQLMQADVGLQPTAIALADFNRDGNTDVAVGGSPGVAVLLAADDGASGSIASINFGFGDVVALATGDFDRDGWPDLAVARDKQLVVLLYNPALGYLNRAMFWQLSRTPSAITAGDLDRDGKLDLVVAADSELQLYRGTGDATLFVPFLTVAVGGSPSAIAVADLNRDGVPDLVLADSAHSAVQVLLGNGDGNFHAGDSRLLGAAPTALAVADVNRDGKPDIAVATASGLTVLLGGDDGSFVAEQLIDTGVRSAALTVGDFNRDGKPDIALVSSQTNDIGVLFNATPQWHTLSFAAQTPIRVPSGVDGYMNGVALGDFNSDGKPDLVSNGLGHAHLFFGHGDGTFDQPAPNLVNVLTGSALVVVDANRDGKDDVVEVGGDGTIRVLLGDGTGEFTAVVGGADLNFVRSMAIGDFDRDGVPDVLTAHYQSGVGILRGKGDGSFTTHSFTAGTSGGFGVASGDLNNDGILDVVAQDLQGHSVDVMLGQDGGQLAPFSPHSCGLPNCYFGVGDFNRDGRLDIAAAGAPTGILFLGGGAGKGDGSFPTTSPFSTGSQLTPNYLVAADFNDDGKLDIATTNATVGKIVAGELGVMLGNGDGTFDDLFKPLPAGLAPIFIITGDLNRDGKLDLVVLDGGDGTLQVYLNTSH